ncbi:MAG: hypothetical protein JW996_01310 [Candidatus Cloacimonetes bacterium]|nr:hypothetical protein [Candidatus Cloacimonadota bacterium]
MSYSREKFLELSYTRKLQLIIRLGWQLEKQWTEIDRRNVLLNEYQNYLIWSEIDLSRELISRNLNPGNRLDFNYIQSRIEQIAGVSLRDDQFLQREKDGSRTACDKIPLYLVLDNLRSAFNVGSIFRTADCLGVSKIFLSGTTVTPDNAKLRKTAMGTESQVDWEYFSSSQEIFNRLRELKLRVYGLEITPDAGMIYDTVFRSPAALIVGNEALGVSPELLLQIDEVVQIPVKGWKHSLNVGVSVAICGYEILRQWRG